MSIKLLAGASVVLGFGIAGFGYMTRKTVSDNFKEQSFWEESIRLLEGYKPAVEKLGEPINFKKVDISDKFNYFDYTTATAKIPVFGKLRNAEFLVYAKRANKDEKWWIEKLELSYLGAGTKYKFYDGAYNKPSNLDAAPSEESKTDTEYIAKK